MFFSIFPRSRPQAANVVRGTSFQCDRSKNKLGGSGLCNAVRHVMMAVLTIGESSRHTQVGRFERLRHAAMAAPALLQFSLHPKKFMFLWRLSF